MWLLALPRQAGQQSVMALFVMLKYSIPLRCWILSRQTTRGWRRHMSFVARAPRVLMEASTGYLAARRWWPAFRMHGQTHRHGAEVFSRLPCIEVHPGEHLDESAYPGLSKLGAILHYANGWNPPSVG